MWEKIFADGEVVARAITDGGRAVGLINCFRRDDADFIGYWIDKEHWGRGIATQAVALLVAEVRRRPLHARVVTHNVASLRALLSSGFVETERRQMEATDRFAAAEVVSLVLE